MKNDINNYVIIPDEKWKIFLKIAFDYSDYFSLKYFINEEWYDASLCDYLRTNLSKWHIWDKDESLWPEYEKEHYDCNFFTMEIIASIESISKMGNNIYPEDLSFFKKDIAWFENISHENISFFKSEDLKLQNELLQNGISFI